MGLTIDLAAVVANWKALAALAPGSRPGAVVKADAYGLGAAMVAPALYGAGARDFFVAQAVEGRAIRPLLGPDAHIFILSGHMPGQDLTGLIPVLNGPGQFFRDRATRPRGAFAIQLDSGMNRLGFEPAEWAAVRSEALSARTDTGIGPALVMSHLMCADDAHHVANAAQLRAFRGMTEGVTAPRSLAATGGVLLGSDYHFDVTRAGIGLYGGEPFAHARPVVTLSLDVIQTRNLTAGEAVGYGCAWTTPRACRIATVSAGYADGLPRALSGKGLRLWAGERSVPVVGRVSMDLITVDVTDLPDVPERLDILNDRQGVDDLAALAGTIGYEILTSLGPRYPREYRPA
ncbi:MULTISPECIES: alanine racemase [unclassified Paracoccus (in: a-proteobacteria)]|uniref:alanine racemase n=1 Tax=unclassified Paracoccus (in: a-proteobacteria) TaxID=2688777 RepID=UPI0015FEE87A|nr:MULTISPECIES: alanine racemase [unclassified Paracoccus (in: a-proteobacteria)]MBB1491950.1 alanine racemase [Paracoccus sp. MC1854]MBB1498187.1 alanine racemase [Paracoccus sp. MC1862]QQO45684.1 alanine racemase [Paracoccus sp. MC1862]